MSYFTYYGKKIFYREVGEGKPGSEGRSALHSHQGNLGAKSSLQKESPERRSPFRAQKNYFTEWITSSRVPSR